MTGKVYLVGAGPGDPGLITVKGMKVLQEAQVVVYDRLVDPAQLKFVSKDAEMIFVGKARGHQQLTQPEINQLLVDKAAQGLNVVRLKGGDPFVFGRGGEEALELKNNGLPFEVVPGVTSAIAALAYAGIPITHRGVSTTFTVVSGSEDPAKPESTIPWDVLAKNGGTLVVLMGWKSLETILETLEKNGLPPTTPAALVQWGTWSDQKTVTGNLKNILELGTAAGLTAPVITVIGDVVNLREDLSWFDKRPLFGKRVLNTRSRSQASRLQTLLEQSGANPLELPTIEIGPLADHTELDATLEQLANYQWIIFASANAVESVFERLALQGKDARALAGTTIGAIGPATAQALANRGITADFVPNRSISEEILSELSGRDWNGVSVLLPAADIGRDELEKGLASMGATVKRLAAYRNVPVVGISDLAKQAFIDGVDVVTFTSSSTVRNLVDMLDGDLKALENSFIACIGPITAATARELGLSVDLEASEHTVEGLVDALTNHFAVGEVSHA